MNYILIYLIYILIYKKWTAVLFFLNISLKHFFCLLFRASSVATTEISGVKI